MKRKERRWEISKGHDSQCGGSPTRNESIRRCVGLASSLCSLTVGLKGSEGGEKTRQYGGDRRGSCLPSLLSIVSVYIQRGSRSTRGRDQCNKNQSSADDGVSSTAVSVPSLFQIDDP